MTTDENNRDQADPAAKISQEMVETTDLPSDTSIRQEYDTLKDRAGATKVVVANADVDGELDAGSGRRPLKISCHACGQKLDLTTLDSFAHVACPACGADLIVPMWFDNYLLEEPGGIGGMATVYRALDLALDREVAIKVLKPELASMGDKSELFLHEARTAATINHSAVIPIYTCGIYENQTYIVMQYMAGGSLENLIESVSEPLPLPNIIFWMRDVAEGLENARQHGIVHHDIKPANIMLDADGKAKIGDFGIAQIVTANDPSFEITRTCVSPHYVSPEKIRTGNEDYRGDIYSLGATFYHLVTGTPPFDHNDLDELIRMRLTADPAAPHLIRKDLPEPLSLLILAMMARSPELRPEYATIIAQLNEYLSKPELLSGKTAARPPQKIPVQGQRKKPARRPAAGLPRAATLPAALRPAPKKSGALMLISHLLSLTLLFCVAVYMLNKFGHMNKFAGFLPTFMQREIKTGSANKSVYPAEVSMNNSAVAGFSTGDPEFVIEELKKALKSDIRAKRMQAALQQAMAAYLADTPDRNPEEFAKSNLDAIESDITEYDKIAFEDDWHLLRYLSGFYGDESEIPPSRFFVAENDQSRGLDWNAKLAAAVMMRQFYSEPKMSKADRLSMLQQLKTALDHLKTQNCWISDAFLPRMKFWEQTVSTGTGVKADLEGLFSKLVTEDGKWKFTPEIPARVRSRDGMKSKDGVKASKEPVRPAVKKNTDDAGNEEPSENDKAPDEAGKEETETEPLEITEDALKAVAEKYDQRPKWENPFFIEVKDAVEYTGKLADSDGNVKRANPEVKRLNRLRKTSDVLFDAFARSSHRYETKDLVWKNGESLGPGSVEFSKDELIFRKADGEDEGTEKIKLKWQDCPVDRLLDFYRFYMDFYSNAQTPDRNLNGSSVHGDALRKNASLCVDYALIAAWYGRYGEAAGALKKAMKISPDKQTRNDIEILFLK